MAEKILIVEDERNIASFVSMYLKNARYTVEIARDGAEALQKAENAKPDLVVLDLMLPDIDGLAVCRTVRQTVPETDVVIVTAFDDALVESTAMQDGASAFVPKHSAAATLEQTIQRIFAKRQRDREQFD